MNVINNNELIIKDLNSVNRLTINRVAIPWQKLSNNIVLLKECMSGLEAYNLVVMDNGAGRSIVRVLLLFLNLFLKIYIHSADRFFTFLILKLVSSTTYICFFNVASRIWICLPLVRFLHASSNMSS